MYAGGRWGGGGEGAQSPTTFLSFRTTVCADFFFFF